MGGASRGPPGVWSVVTGRILLVWTLHRLHQGQWVSLVVWPQPLGGGSVGLDSRHFTPGVPPGPPVGLTPATGGGLTALDSTDSPWGMRSPAGGMIPATWTPHNPPGEPGLPTVPLGITSFTLSYNKFHKQPCLSLTLAAT